MEGGGGVGGGIRRFSSTRLCTLCVKCLTINPNEIGLNWKLCGISCRNVFRNVVQTLRYRVQYAENLTQY